MDSVLAKDYPSPIRELYTGVLRKDRPSERHHQLLRLGETSLSYLAALAFADYRRLRGDDPVSEVEAAVGAMDRATAGDYMSLFRVSQRTLGREEIFGIRRYEINVKLEHAQRLAAAVRAIEHARRIRAQDVERVVEEGLRQSVKAVRWLGFWDHFVEYRNRVIHADDKSWPVDAVGYYEVMTPLLESALVEALRTEYIAHVLLEYPVARLVSVERSYDSWTLRFDGEYRGAPLVTQVSTESPPHAWQSELDKKYILARANGGWSVYSRFYDLRAGELPSPLIQGGTPSPDIERRTDAPVAGPMQGRRMASRESPAVGPAGGPERMGTPTGAEHGQPLHSTAVNSTVLEQEAAWPAADATRGASWARRAAALGLDQLSMWTVTLAVLFPCGYGYRRHRAVRRRPREGQTFGKQVLDARVVPEVEGSLSSRNIVVRELLLKNLLFGLPSVFLLGVPALVNYLWPLWDRRSRTLHDHLCATRELTDLPT